VVAVSIGDYAVEITDNHGSSTARFVKN